MAVPEARAASAVDGASDALRSALIFLPPDGSATRAGDALVLLTPSNPGYWWGNGLLFDGPPRDGDFDRWMRLFDERVHRAQPASRHRTFGWDGDDAGRIGPFVDAGFVHFETLMLVARRGEPVRAPHPAPVDVRRLADDARWREFAALLVATREPGHAADAYATFVAGRVAGWRALEARGQGGFFCIVDDGRLVAALGVFAEAVCGTDGRRIGRYQHVVTTAAARRRGYAGTLVAHAAAYAFEGLDVDALLIAADANDAARRVYEAAGFRPATRHHGLERAS